MRVGLPPRVVDPALKTDMKLVSVGFLGEEGRVEGLGDIALGGVWQEEG